MDCVLGAGIFEYPVGNAFSWESHSLWTGQWMDGWIVQLLCGEADDDGVERVE